MAYVVDLQPCSFLRRIAAILYDSVLLFAVLFLATALLLPFTHGNAIKSGNYLYLSYLLLISCIYFSWQWTNGGQTLGMRAWRVRLLDMEGQPVNGLLATKRFFFSLVSWLLAGVGLLWAAFDNEKLALHDHCSDTRLYVVKKKPTRAAKTSG